jgi:4'-phosphopantetheinyl transferase
MTPVLAPGEVIVYLARPEQLRSSRLVARFEAILTSEERARVRRFRFDEHRHEHLVSHALVRVSLSRHRPVAPEAWRFRIGAHGRPQIDPPCGLSFNATNTPLLVACAVAEDSEVGVDAEPATRAETILEVAGTVFATSEMEGLGAASPQHTRALALWTLKEAYIKARGMGLALPLRQIAFDLPLDREIALETTPGVDPDPARWRFRLIDLEDHMLAVALACGSSPLSVRIVETALFED